jgi:hypothetical protein
LGLILLAAIPFRIPSRSELTYLLGPARRAWPDFIQGDWTLAAASAKSFAFDAIVAPFLRFLPVSVVVLGGRLLACLALAWLLLRLGRRLGVSAGGVALVVVAWLLLRQSLIGGERIIQAFEPKLLGYVCLFAALERGLADRFAAAGLWIGACFSLHPGVGAVGGAATVGATLLDRRGWRPLITLVGFAGVTALPGLIPLLGSAAEEGLRDHWRWQTLARMPFHLDAFTFGAQGLALTAVMFLTCAVAARRRWDEPAMRFGLGFLLCLGLVFAGGVAARWAERFELLQVYPFRVFPALVALFCGLLVARSVKDWRVRRQRPLELVLALPLLLLLPRLTGSLGTVAGGRLWLARPPDDLGRSFEWLSQGAPPTAVAVLPPWREDSYWRSRRAHVAALSLVRTDSLERWRERIGALVGLGDDRLTDSAMTARYERLTPRQVQTIRRRYGGDYLVSRIAYPFREVHREGAYRVYDLTSRSPDSVPRDTVRSGRTPLDPGPVPRP